MRTISTFAKKDWLFLIFVFEWGVSKLEKNVKICSEQNVNLFGNFSKFVRGVSKLAGFFIFKLTVFSMLFYSIKLSSASASLLITMNLQ
jgi:hypothetical protein